MTIISPIHLLHLVIPHSTIFFLPVTTVGGLQMKKTQPFPPKESLPSS